MHTVHYFIHVPKTAGTTVRSWLSRVYAKGEVFYVYPEYEAASTADGYSREELLRRAAEIPASVRMFYGHYPFDPAELLHPDCRGLGFVRDASARILSWQRFVEHKGANLRDPIVVKACGRFREGASLPEVWQEFGGIAELDNGIVRMFSAATGPAGTVGEADLARAVENVERYFDFVGHMERFEASMKRIAEVLGKPYEATVDQNASPGGRSEAHMAEALADPVLSDWLAARTEFDRRFVRWVTERFHGSHSS